MKKTITTNIAPWGNSFGVRIPKDFLEQGGFEIETPVSISLSEKTLSITANRLPDKVKSKEFFKKAFKNSKLVKAEELDWGTPQGKEIW
jgi:antitoxin component of MazEF toxin-antitoxin module